MGETPLLAGKRVVVTGASRGIGRAIAIACAQSGADGRHQLLSAPRRRRARAGGPDWRQRDAPAMRRPRFGRVCRGPLRRSSAAVAASMRSSTMPASTARRSSCRRATTTSTRSVRTNVIGPMTCIRAATAARCFVSGVASSSTSVRSRRSGRRRGQTVYAATKGALEALTRAVAVEYGRKGIRCHCLRPGPVDTDMFAATKALAEAEVLARVPLACFVTAGRGRGLRRLLAQRAGVAPSPGPSTRSTEALPAG